MTVLAIEGDLSWSQDIPFNRGPPLLATPRLFLRELDIELPCTQVVLAYQPSIPGASQDKHISMSNILVLGCTVRYGLGCIF